MKIYTKTGDSGQTALVGGFRVSKASERLEAYGTIDELNSHLGLLAALPSTDTPTTATLREIQNKLFNLGAYLATPTPATLKGIDATSVAAIEQEIDRLDATLPQLRCFILPGGTPDAAQANIARTVCRRAERRLVALDTILADTLDTPLDPMALSYVNRLSDYLFTLGRHLNAAAGKSETPWQP